jgi:hypothetical protein
MSISDTASKLLVKVDKDSEIAQYYGWFPNLLKLAIDNRLSAEQRDTLIVQLPKFRGGSLKVDAEIDALMAALSHN